MTTRSVRLLLVLGLLALLPGLAVAIQTQREVVTVQIDFTSPGGNTFVGTVVANRDVTGNQSIATWTFKGTINGRPADAAGTARERWISAGQEEVQVTSVITWNVPMVRQSLVMEPFTVLQTSPNLLSVKGIPLAIDGSILKPGSGNATYAVTAPGEGSRAVRELPNTAGVAGVAAHPAFIILALVGAGSLLILLGRRLRRPRGIAGQ